MVARLSDSFDWFIVTRDRDSGDPAPYAGVSVAEWTSVGGARVYYLPPEQLNAIALRRVVNSIPFDAMYLNSFFDPLFSTVPLALRRMRAIEVRPTLLAPRGEFSPGALALKSAKKRSYRLVAGGLGLHRDLIWQASSDVERSDIIRALKVSAADVYVAQDLAPPPPPLGDRRQSSEGLSLVFLSRISPMKNLRFALEVLRSVRVPVRFDIYGPAPDEGYAQQCVEIASTLPAHIAVRFMGEVAPDEVHGVLGRYDLMFLPTLGENYGHSIHEALVSGTPVLISDRTPWRALGQDNAGFDLPLGDPQGFAEAIAQYSQLSEAERQMMRRCARARGLRKSEELGDLAANKKLFDRLVRASPHREVRI
ncbi:glycosyltransferase [Phenylobacterium sp.]|uniref:glycosyltransferase family 4 protein n=1 Tax=Phenylobacterium sp. TaxID=1871053 RepID=UPI002810FC65|nr:glycosyltransferase [Phenylobacterium sp.]